MGSITELGQMSEPFMNAMYAHSEVFFSLTSYTMEGTVSRQFILSDERKSRKVFRLPLSRHWNVPIKAIFPKQQDILSKWQCASKALTKSV